jgi:molecular chaperone DnaJ
MSGIGNFGGFDDLFGGGRRARRRTLRGSDLRATLSLTYEEIATGAEKTIRLKRFDTCPTCEGSGAAEGGGLVACPACHGAGEIRQVQRSLMGQIVNVTQCRNCTGTGQVVDRPCRFCHGEGRTKQSRDIKIKVPPGVASGNYMTLEGEGNRGPRGSLPGDLLVLFEEKAHPIFTRHGNNVLLEVNISFAEAALGMSLEVPTLEGKAKLKFPASIQSGHILRMRGKGFPGLHHRGRGDQLVRIQVMSPAMVSAAQQKIFQQLQKSEKAISPRERFSRSSEQ